MSNYTGNYAGLPLDELKEAAADLHADQQAMPDPGPLAAHREIVQAAYDLGVAHGKYMQERASYEYTGDPVYTIARVYREMREERTDGNRD